MSADSFQVYDPMAYSVARVSPRFVEAPLVDGWNRLAKGIIDRGLALVLLVLFAPTLVLLAVITRLDSPGPSVIKQTRVGERGRSFFLYKFRTTQLDALDSEAETTSLEMLDLDGWSVRTRRDPRLTRVGRFLRRTSMDEMPQLFNVLRGEMSLVGPRPRQPDEVDFSDREGLRPLLVKPGLTGLAQVAGMPLTRKQSQSLDVLYVDSWSLSMDVRILVRTVGVILGERDS